MRRGGTQSAHTGLQVEEDGSPEQRHTPTHTCGATPAPPGSNHPSWPGLTLFSPANRHAGLIFRISF
ncbi:hypothetical protein EYF80_043706 [Liparis tanakae]|uniref:Uncharacterized protein n=1 Tax=Liparis tanakae TaxID=230148 RepID=A0A4Z2FXQ4_9TELE|nr:hypothetical protein EYF80_043706 [Liparis tanakae]